MSKRKNVLVCTNTKVFKHSANAKHLCRDRVRHIMFGLRKTLTFADQCEESRASEIDYLTNGSYINKEDK